MNIVLLKEIFLGLSSCDKELPEHNETKHSFQENIFELFATQE